MIRSKYINGIILGLVIVAMIFTSLMMFSPETLGFEAADTELEYVERLFGENQIIRLEIHVDETEWQQMLEHASSEEYITCDVTINGTTLYSVGIRPKGNSSLTSVLNSDSDRYSFKIQFDENIKGQTYFGLDKLVLNNIHADTTYMKEVISYDIMNYIGVTTPLMAYTNITVNGEPWGFYLALEAYEDGFVERVYGTEGLAEGNLYNVKGSFGGGMGGGMERKPGENNQGARRTNRNGANEGAPQNVPANVAQNATVDNSTTQNPTPGFQPPTMGENPGGFPGGGMPGFGSGGGGSLVYTDDDPDSYSAIFGNAVFKSKEEDYQRVITALKKLSEGEELETYFDVDQILRYFAAHTVVVNLDSYISNMQQNYYLYEQGGKVTILPWDYNLAFGGFQGGSATSAVNFPIDTPVSGVALSDRPLLAKLLENETYLEKYHQYLSEIVEGYFNSGYFIDKIDQLDKLIQNYVKEDASAFFTYDQYVAGVDTLKQFGILRAQSIQGQLEGSIPSTTEGQSAAPDQLIDASAINLSTMGSQGGGGMGMGRNQGNSVGQTQPQVIGEGNSPNRAGQTQPPGTVGQANSAGQTQQPPGGMTQPGEVGQMQPPGGMGQPNDRVDLDPEVMMQVMNILQNSQGEELTEEQLEELQALGLTDEEIDIIKELRTNLPQIQGPNGGNFNPMNPGERRGENTQGTGQNLLWLAASGVTMTLALVFVFKYRRRKPL